MLKPILPAAGSEMVEDTFHQGAYYTLPHNALPIAFNGHKIVQVHDDPQATKGDLVAVVRHLTSGHFDQ